MKYNLIVTLFAATLALPVAAQEEVTADTIVATVAGEDITMTHIIDVRRQLPEQYQNLPAETLFNGILDQLIQQRVLAASLEETPAWLDEAMENERASLLAGLAVAELSRLPVAEEDVQAAYDAQFGDVGGAAEFNASHILVDTEEEALELIKQLEGGADFAELAMEFSTGPSGPRGGELGWFGIGMMVPPFEAAVTELDVGATSAPVQTQFGWHVIKLNDARTQEPPSLEDVRADLEGQLVSEALETRIAELTEAAAAEKIDGIDPNTINTLDIFGQ